LKWHEGVAKSSESQNCTLRTYAATPTAYFLRILTLRDGKMYKITTHIGKHSDSCDLLSGKHMAFCNQKYLQLPKIRFIPTPISPLSMHYLPLP